jgi:hypothetical protein
MDGDDDRVLGQDGVTLVLHDGGEVSDRLEGIKKRRAKASSGAGAGAQLSVEGQNGEGLTGVNRLAQRIVWLPSPDHRQNLGDDVLVGR